MFVILANLVSDENRLEYEEYCQRNVKQQLQAAIDYSGSDKTIEDDIGEPLQRISLINITTREFRDHPGPGPYLVNWQRAPFFPSFIMTDMLAQRTMADAVATSNITKTPTLNFAELTVGVTSQIVQPIFRDILPTDGNRDELELVAILRVSILWENYFKNLLPQETPGIVIVMEDKCGIKMTFEINGLEAKSLGLGDVHNASMDEYEISSEFLSFEYDNTTIYTTRRSLFTKFDHPCLSNRRINGILCNE